MKIEYDAIIYKDEEHNGSYCDIPFNVLETFGKKRVKIKALIDAVEYRGLLTPMGGKYGLFMNKEVRDKVGKTYGKTVHISIEEDIMIVLVVAPLLEVINNCHFRWVVFQHQLCRDAWYKRTTQTQCGQIYKFAANRTT